MKRYESALIRAAQAGTAKICAVFGGQGPNNFNCFNDLVELYQNHPTILTDLIHTGAETLSKLATLSQGFHENWGFDLRTWLANSHTAPSREHFALAPMSFPLNTLLSLAHYCIACHSLGMEPGQLKASISSVISHSQGLFAAEAVARADSWASFYESCDMALRISFWVGLEAHLAAPYSYVSAAAVSDCIEHGEGQPSSMLSISGLNESQILATIEKLNKILFEERRPVYLALKNSGDKFVIAGPPQSLRSVCLYLRKMKAPTDLDQSRIPFANRKPEVNMIFLPISAPFHTPYLSQVDSVVTKTLSAITRKGETCTGKSLQDWKSKDFLETVIRAVTCEICDWPKTCSDLDATHLLDFGPGQIGSLTHDTTEGTGLRIIRMTDSSNSFSESVGSRSEVFSTNMPPASPNWKQMFAPRLLATTEGVVGLQTKMTRVFEAPPVMVAGMTPTTVPWDFVAAVMQAGYHIELAGGGYSSRRTFESAIRNLAAAIPAHRAITCNLLYANPKTIAWQISSLRSLIRDGIAIDGVTIGAGIPSPDVVKDYIESIGLKHISFKPGSESSIHQVIGIAQRYPDFPIGLQWTGGRAGGHHSYEDFHQPILKNYGRIRKCSNIILIAGSGFGDAEDTWPYLCGDWAHSFGYPSMPFDGILLGSRMMVAKEAHTSYQAKQLIVEAQGIDDVDWYKSYDEPVGGIMTITSEMGQPIHMLATRGVMLWKELDRRVFSIRDPARRVEYLHMHRNEIISRLNKDFSRPWFAVDPLGRNVELEDMSYLGILQRLCELTYVHHQNRWIDPSYRTLVHDFLDMTQERFGLRISSEWDQPREATQIFCETLGSHANCILYPQDRDILMNLFRRGGQKPVPFIPSLDYNFETWFKKDSLWQSEDVDAVVGQDVQRICIIHGPVAARYSTSREETAKTILDNICKKYARKLNYKDDGKNLSHVQQDQATRTTLRAISGVRVTESRSTRRYQILQAMSPAELSMLVDDLTDSAGSWAKACLKNEWIIRGTSRVANPIRAAFQPQPGDVVEAQLTQESKLQKLIFYPQGSSGKEGSSTVLTIASKSDRNVTATITPPLFLCAKAPRADFTFQIRDFHEQYHIYQHMPDHFDQVRNLYAELWKTGRPGSIQNVGLNSEFSSDELKISKKEVQDYVRVIGQTSPSKLQAWNPRETVPLDYCIVIVWTALLKPLLIPTLPVDLLRLLHRSIDLKYAPGARPLGFEEVVRTVSRITAIKAQPAGTLIEVSANICRGSELVVLVKSEFFIQGTSGDFETHFSAVEEPEMVVDIKSELVSVLLSSRKWLVCEGSFDDLIGKTLLFRLTTHTMFNQNGDIASLQVSGTISVLDIPASSNRLGRVYFEDENCSENPVMEFLNRHGARRVERQTLERPGWAGDSTIHVRAPSHSAPYAKVSHDTNPIHACPVFARYAGFTGTVVHGMQTSAIVRRVVEWAVGDTDRSRFKGWRVSFEDTVRPNELLRIEIEHAAMEEGRMILKVQAFKEESGEKVIEAEAEVEQLRTGYLFCGQGSQEKSMGMSLYARSPEAKVLWDRGDAHLKEQYGFSILQIIRENPKSLTIHFGGKRGRRVRNTYLAMTRKSPQTGQEEPILEGLTPRSTSYTFSHSKGLLFSTQFSQPALALMEMVEYKHLLIKGFIQSDALFAGHSLGEYAALGACTTFMEFENLLTLVFYRGLKMQNALKRDEYGRTDYSMMAVDPSRVGKGIVTPLDVLYVNYLANEVIVIDFTQHELQILIDLINQQTKLLLEIVNHNVASQQYVCAGHYRALWLLGSICDELSQCPSPHILSTEELLEKINLLLPSAESLTNDAVLKQGKATIPLSGIDIPFHSKMLRGEIQQYREYLSRKVNAVDVKPSELVGKWIPNITGEPFSLEKSYVEKVQQVTGSEALRELLRAMDG